MSKHDRGAFGALLAEAKANGLTMLTFDVRLTAEDEDPTRWIVTGTPCEGPNHAYTGGGRTGEAALRQLVERLRVAREAKRG